MDDMQLNRMDILKKVENGELSLEEASKLLSELEQVEELPRNEPEVVVVEKNINTENVPAGENEKPGWAFVFWVAPLILGLILTVFSSTWLYQNYLSSGLGFKFWLTWIPFSIGVFLIYFGWLLQKARWIHINIKQPKGESPQRIFLAFPLPFQFIGFVMKIIKGKFSDKMSNIEIEELLKTVDDHIKKDEPLYVNVDDDDGTKVEVYIG